VLACFYVHMLPCYALEIQKTDRYVCRYVASVLPWIADGTVKAKDFRNGGRNFNESLSLALTKVSTMDKRTMKRLTKQRLRGMLQEVKVCCHFHLRHMHTAISRYGFT
jgi:hypothetical protein